MKADSNDITITTAAKAPSPAGKSTGGRDKEGLALLNRRLTHLFRGVPDLVAVAGIENKLRHAAAVLTGEGLFQACAIFMEDPDSGIVCVAEGEAEADASCLPERSAELRSRVGDGNAIVVPADATEENSTPKWIVLLPMKGHDGRLVGVAELRHEDASLNRADVVEIVTVFLTETVQAVEQFRLERELERNEARYRGLVDNVSDLIFRVDREGQLTFVSRRAQDMIGRPWR
ncbi:PAS domain-containing protein, partial [bacterium]|nr:PAS domain-containing protein [bacterium]